jgi:hypothetical protein
MSVDDRFRHRRRREARRNCGRQLAQWGADPKGFSARLVGAMVPVSTPLRRGTLAIDASARSFWKLADACPLRGLARLQSKYPMIFE